jgi:hypothetical protein
MAFTYKLVLEDGTPAEPPKFVSSEPNWHVGAKVLIRPGTEYRIVAIDQAADWHAVWTVEHVPNGH